MPWYHLRHLLLTHIPMGGQARRGPGWGSSTHLLGLFWARVREGNTCREKPHHSAQPLSCFGWDSRSNLQLGPHRRYKYPPPARGVTFLSSALPREKQKPLPWQEASSGKTKSASRKAAAPVAALRKCHLWTTWLPAASPSTASTATSASNTSDRAQPPPKQTAPSGAHSSALPGHQPQAPHVPQRLRDEGAQEASLAIPQALRCLGSVPPVLLHTLGRSQALPSALRAHTEVLQQPKGSTHPTSSLLSCSVTLTGTEAAFSSTQVRGTAAFPPHEVWDQVPKGQPKPSRKAVKEMQVLNKTGTKQFQFREQQKGNNSLRLLFLFNGRQNTHSSFSGFKNCITQLLIFQSSLTLIHVCS